MRTAELKNRLPATFPASALLVNLGQGVLHANLLGLETSRLRRDDALHLGHRVHNLP